MAGAGDPNLPSFLAQAVRGKDYTAQLAAREAGGAALATLVPLVDDPDEEVRELAVHCLAETGDPGAGAPLVKATLDRDVQVAMAAARGLHKVGGAVLVPALLAALTGAAEPLVRRELALVLGRLAGPGKIADLRAILARETADEPRQALIAALARLGDVDARQELADALVAGEGVARKPWLELAEYVGQPWLLGPLGSLLDDETPIVRVGVDARPDLIQELRACDLAVILIAAIGAAKLSFAVTRAKNYAPAEREEARRFVWSS